MDFDVTKMTRAQAERFVARTTDAETLRRLGDHRNSHVRAKAAYKVRKLFPIKTPVEGVT